MFQKEPTTAKQMSMIFCECSVFLHSAEIKYLKCFMKIHVHAKRKVLTSISIVNNLYLLCI